MGRLHLGVDLSDEVKDRLTAALAPHARHRLGEPAPAAERGGPGSAGPCGGRIDRGGESGSPGKSGSGMGPGLEVAPHHLEDRLGGSVPAAHRLAAGARPAGTDNLFVAWETLTHVAKPGEKAAE